MSVGALKYVVVALCLMLLSGRALWTTAIADAFAELETRVSVTSADRTGPKDSPDPATRPADQSSDSSESDDDDGDGDGFADAGLTLPFMTVVPPPYSRTRLQSTEDSYREPYADTLTRPPRA